MGQTWEHRLALRLPRPLLFGTLLIAVCLSAAYVSFQWFFGFRVESSAFGMEVFLVTALIAPAYFFGPYDRLQVETEVRTFYVARDVIRTSRFAGAAAGLGMGRRTRGGQFQACRNARQPAQNNTTSCY